jgi:hypothetical protein
MISWRGDELGGPSYEGIAGLWYQGIRHGEAISVHGR